MPVGKPDETLEGTGVMGGAPGERRTARLGIEPGDHPGEVAPGLRRALRRGAVPQVARQLGQPDQRRLRKVARQHHEADRMARPRSRGPRRRTVS